MQVEGQQHAQRLAVMARLQDRYNTDVHASWRIQGYEYYRAIWVECAELLDHFGWKWWKHQQPDLEQVRLELVDIWHFGLSDLIRAGRLTDEIVRPLVEAPGERTDPRSATEALAQATLGSRAFPVQEFADLMHALEMTFDELFDLYVGKNVLNAFRLDHGYQTGDYLKLWRGREDNVHLMEIVRALDCPPEQYQERLYAALESRYPGS